MPRLQAAALRAAGVPDNAISIIPDEQAAITAALEMGRPGDLVLIFADALARSWKQITKFKMAGAAPSTSVAAGGSETDFSQSGSARFGGATGFAAAPSAGLLSSDAVGSTGEVRASAFSMEGVIRDERGVRLAPETED